ncbi:hypothetical protein LTR36_005793 [Oleoguttula mirabilis]|uniref:Uncharacterized protein n=1 Tax=Oleoguttula mirabilis TaxID=1507867 RepID=A0AAV9JEE0_9PEZI|nr:hypothetical protein LTR36_005793 [Oleoguttula mirabilis]
MVVADASTTATLTQGAVARIGGQTVSAQNNGVVVGSSTIAFSAGSHAQVIPIGTLTAGDQTVTAYGTSGSIVLAGDGSTTTLSSGALVSFAGRTISAAAYRKSDRLHSRRPYTITAVSSGGSVILEDISSTITLSNGAEATFESQTISALSSGSGVFVHGISTVVFSNAASQSTDGVSEAVITASSQTFTVLASSGGSYIVVEDSSSTLTLPDGSAAAFESQTLSALPSGECIVVDGTSTIFLTSAPSSLPTTAAGEAVITASGHTFTATQTGSEIVLLDASSTITLLAGSETIFDGQTVSADSSGNVMVVDGSVTQTLSRHSGTSAVSSSGGVGGGSGGHQLLPRLARRPLLPAGLALLHNSGRLWWG